MPIELTIKGKEFRLEPTTNWQEVTIVSTDFSDISVNTQKFYVEVIRL